MLTTSRSAACCVRMSTFCASDEDRERVAESLRGDLAELER
jgi:hypothetical protein